MHRGKGMVSLLAPTLGVPVFLLLVPVLVSASWMYGATSALIVATIILSIGVVTGHAGMISLCQMTFAAVGAWVFLWLQVHAPGVPFLADILIGGLITVPVGLLIALPALRLRGENLAVITLAFAVALNVILAVNDFPGIAEGIFVQKPAFIDSDQSYFYFCAVVFCLVAGTIALLSRTRIGASWLAVKYSERATAALGRSVGRAKMSAFGFSAFVAGIAGGLLVGQVGAVTVQAFSPLFSLTFFALAVMVGARYPEGALIGGVLSAFIPVVLDAIGVAQDMGDLLFAFGAVVGLIGGAGVAEAIRAVCRSKLSEAPSHPAFEADVGAPPGTAAARPGKELVSSALALELEGLTVRFGHVTALEGVSLQVPAGVVAALIGPNGAGKSTLVDCVSGLIRSYEGVIRLDGQEIDRLPPHRRARLGLRRSFQQDRTIPELSIDQYVRLSLGRRQSSQLSRTAVTEMLTFFGCPGPQYRVNEVDIGTRRLLEVVAAVAANPSIVLLDEPAAGLAQSESEVLAKRISEIPERYGPSVLLIEHDMELVQAACSQITVLDFGRVIAYGDPADVLADETVIKAYLGEEITL